MSIISWNIQSVNSPNDAYPSKLLNPDFTQILGGGDIVCLQETKGPIKIPGYVFHDSLRPGHKSGGVSIGYKRGLQTGIRTIKGATGNPDIIICRLDKNFFEARHHTYIITAYVPPSNSSCKFLRSRPPCDTFSDILREITALPNGAPVILCGDLNARTAEKTTSSPTRDSITPPRTYPDPPSAYPGGIILTGLQTLRVKASLTCAPQPTSSSLTEGPLVTSSALQPASNGTAAQRSTTSSPRHPLNLSSDLCRSHP